MTVDSGHNGPASLAVTNLARRFGRNWALAGVSFELPAGAALMVTGPNGSGKSTLLMCCSSLSRYHAGRIEFLGQELWPHRFALRRHLALLSHDNHLYEDLSALDNLRIHARLGAIASRPQIALQHVGLQDSQDKLVRSFSAGMRRRLALARLLLHKPTLLLLDEPFAALDEQGRKLMTSAILKHCNTGGMAIIATHLPSITAPICPLHMQLEQGVVSQFGPPQVNSL